MKQISKSFMLLFVLSFNYIPEIYTAAAPIDQKEEKQSDIYFKVFLAMDNFDKVDLEIYPLGEPGETQKIHCGELKSVKHKPDIRFRIHYYKDSIAYKTDLIDAEPDCIYCIGDEAAMQQEKCESENPDCVQKTGNLYVRVTKEK